MVSVKSLVFALAASLTAATELSQVPKAPELKYLYTSFVNLTDPVPYGVGPKGPRVVIPIIGGNFTGPKLKG
jgi:hypothetical protein